MNLQKLEKSVAAAEAGLAAVQDRKAAALATVGSGEPSPEIRAELMGLQVDVEVAEARIRAALKALRAYFESEVAAELAGLPEREAAFNEAFRSSWSEAGRLIEGGLRYLKTLGPPASRLIENIERGVASLSGSEGELWKAGAAEAALSPEPADVHSELSRLRSLQNLQRDRGLRTMRVNSKFDRALAHIRSGETR